jgi:hypothetical protein
MNEKAIILPQSYEDSDSNDAKRFKELALRYQEIGALFDIRIHPFRSPDLPLFQKATPEQRKKVSDFLETILSIHEETLAATEAPINTRQLLWRALRRLSLVPGPEVFEKIQDEDVVVIYGEEQKAVFWNLQFFKFSSFSVEEMFFGDWYVSTKREPLIQEKLYQMAVSIMSGKITGLFVPDVPPHEVEEIDSIERMKTLMEIPFGSVLTKDGSFGGIMLIKRMRVL